MEIICIDNSHRIKDSLKVDLTIGKIYKILSYSTGFYKLIDDKEEIGEYFAHRFKTKQQNNK